MSDWRIEYEIIDRSQRQVAPSSQMHDLYLKNGVAMNCSIDKFFILLSKELSLQMSKKVQKIYWNQAEVERNYRINF
jgi:hypothetical protein